jgi:hypothetical protein
MAGRAPVRTLMGTWSDLGSWQRVYETAEALEVDESNGMTGTRHRVFYDEVLLVTYHSFVGWPLALMAGLAGALIGMFALAAAMAGDGRTAVTIAFFGLLAAVFLVVRLVVKVDAVTIYGRRSRARASFWLNKDRARASYLRVCARVRRAQERAAGRSAGGPAVSTEVAS